MIAGVLLIYFLPESAWGGSSVKAAPISTMPEPILPEPMTILGDSFSSITTTPLSPFGSVPIAMRAAEQLHLEGINTEVIDLRTAVPMDKETIFKSVAKTGRLVVADTAWQSFGVSAEISASVSENIFDSLKAPVVRVALPDTHAPTSSALESLFYPGDEDVVEAVKSVLKK